MGQEDIYETGLDKAHMMRVTRKQTLRSLSLSYQKKDGRA